MGDQLYRLIRSHARNQSRKLQRSDQHNDSQQGLGRKPDLSASFGLSVDWNCLWLRSVPTATEGPYRTGSQQLRLSFGRVCGRKTTGAKPARPASKLELDPQRIMAERRVDDIRLRWTVSWQRTDRIISETSNLKTRQSYSGTRVRCASQRICSSSPRHVVIATSMLRAK